MGYYKMEYKILSGRTVETRSCLLPAKSEGQHPKRRAPRRAGASSLKKIQSNEVESVRRLARLLNCNFGKGDIHVVRSYNDENLPASLEEAEKEFAKIVRKLRDTYRKQTGANLKYVWVPSDRDSKTGQPARIHHHLVMNRVSYDILSGLIGDTGELNYSYLDGRGDHTSLAAYMLANGKSRDQYGKNRWRCSKGLERPIFTEPEIVDEIEELEAPEGAQVMENYLHIDEATGLRSAYLRCVLPEPPKVTKNTVHIPKPKRKKGKKKRRKR